MSGRNSNSNGTNSNNQNNLSPEQRAELLMYLMHDVLRGGGGGGEEEEDDDDDAVICPVCNTRHEPREETDSPQGQQLSHGAMTIYVSVRCPVCLDDPAGPPMVALPCGHPICQDDFQRLGGDLSAATPSENNTRQMRQDRHSRRRIRNAVDMMELFMYGVGPFAPVVQESFPFPPNGPMFVQDDDDDDDDSDMPPLIDHSGSNDESDSDMPPLERTDGQDDEEEEDMPPLQEPNDATRDSEQSVPDLLARGSDNDSSSDEHPVSHFNHDEDDESHDDSMPPLENMGGREQFDDDIDNDEDSIPGLVQSRGRDQDDFLHQNERMPGIEQDRWVSSNGEHSRTWEYASSNDDEYSAHSGFEIDGAQQSDEPILPLIGRPGDDYEDKADISCDDEDNAPLPRRKCSRREDRVSTEEAGKKISTHLASLHRRNVAMSDKCQILAKVVSLQARWRGFITRHTRHQDVVERRQSGVGGIPIKLASRLGAK